MGAVDAMSVIQPLRAHAARSLPILPATPIAPVIEGNGTPEAIWHAWSALRAVPLWAPARLCSPAARLVVLAPHPDDEILACGGLLALHVGAGGRALVLAASDGEASHRGHGSHHEAPLAAQRRSESAEGLRRLIKTSCQTTCEVHRLQLPDGAIAQHVPQLARALTALLQPDDVLVTTWRQDAHPDHDSCGAAAKRAAARVGCRLIEAPVWMWHWSHPADARVPWGRLVAAQIPPDLLLRKQYALTAHASQLTPRSSQTGPVLGPEILLRLAREREYFFV